jgi:hypothetical protein
MGVSCGAIISYIQAFAEQAPSLLVVKLDFCDGRL